MGARAVQETSGYDGAGVGVAIIDSGITSWHDDLTYTGSSRRCGCVNGQRVAKFVDFVNGRTTAVRRQRPRHARRRHHRRQRLGLERRARRHRAGGAPGQPEGARRARARLHQRRDRGPRLGRANKTAYNIRVINLSVGAAVTESYDTDPLTLAAKRAVDAGIVVVAAAGNMGKNAHGAQYGAITAPGNAPWVLTVGAYSHQGTTTRTDDVMAPYSSHGPTAIDFDAKPDLVAPGTGIVSLSSAGSTFYRPRPRTCSTGTLAIVLQAVPEPLGDQHGGPGRRRNGRADAAGESEADAEPGEGDPQYTAQDLPTTTR